LLMQRWGAAAWGDYLIFFISFSLSYFIYVSRISAE